ncbi:MAG TPA: hypothetical protein PLM07_18445 [Candidatus Rifleibacterium sp.]|nr:MAG: hypothetical protein GQF41_3801 [Candidatus Rifleibacterium amylolyticum]HNX78043.1 hypothetical protein [Candidatus Rifleibacterium sp.]HPT47863.1 hypothetical protein [Candidatus Rifleibacterium sp.]
MTDSLQAPAAKAPLPAQDSSQVELLATKLFNKKNSSTANKEEITIVLEQYKLLVDSTEKVYEKRQSANSFFLTLNAGLFTILGYLYGKDADISLRFMAYILPIFGIAICYYWARVIDSYKQLNCGKFKVIEQIETHLPLALFTAEWFALAKGENPVIYHPVTNLERRIAIFFLITYVFILLYVIPFKEILLWLSSL